MLTVIHNQSFHLMSATHQLCCTKLNSNENDQSNILLICFAYIYIYIYKSKHTRQRLAVATQSFTPVGDLQATDISNLLHAHINKADI